MNNDVVKCLVRNSINEILVIKRSENDSHGGMWETPGGGVDESDVTTEAACIREVLEEAGLNVSVRYSRTVEMVDDESGEKYNVHLYNGTPIIIKDEDGNMLNGSFPDLSENPDHTDFMWVSIDEIGFSFDNDHVLVDSWTSKQLSYEQGQVH